MVKKIGLFFWIMVALTMLMNAIFAAFGYINYLSLKNDGVLVEAILYNDEFEPSSGNEHLDTFLEWEFEGDYYSAEVPIYAISIDESLVGGSHDIYIDEDNPEDFAFAEFNYFLSIILSIFVTVLFYLLYKVLNKPRKSSKINVKRQYTGK